MLKRGDLGAGLHARCARDKDQHLPKGARCSALDETDLTVTGDAASPDFRFAQRRRSSPSARRRQVYRTLREANTSWGRGSTAQTTTCLGDIVRLSAAPGQQVTLVSAKRVPFPSVSPKTAAYRIVREHHGRRQPAHSRLRRRRDPPARKDPVGNPLHVRRTAGRKGRSPRARKVVAGRMARAAGPSGPIA